MSTVTHAMKLARTNEKEIERLKDILNEIENFGNELKTRNFRDINIEDDKDYFENLYPIWKEADKDIERFLEMVFRQFDVIHHSRILFNLSTLLDNCADKELSYLDFNKDIKRGFEAVELLEKITKHFEAVAVPNEFRDLLNKAEKLVE